MDVVEGKQVVLAGISGFGHDVHGALVGLQSLGHLAQISLQDTQVVPSLGIVRSGDQRGLQHGMCLCCTPLSCEHHAQVVERLREDRPCLQSGPVCVSMTHPWASLLLGMLHGPLQI